MSIINSILRKFHNTSKTMIDDFHEFCPRCEANLALQNGFSSDVPYWICKGCGEMLINPAVDSDISWICDQCGAMLNIQEGFTEAVGEWECLECGFINKIDKANLYLSEAEYQADLNNPFKGLSDADVINLTAYVEVEDIDERSDISIVQDEEGRLYVRKCLKTYDKSVYEYLMAHPIKNMPTIKEVCEGDNCLIVIEEYIKGETLEQLLQNKRYDEQEAIRLIVKLAHIVKALHDQKPPIIHRDIKPSNIIVNDNDEVMLLDMNAAKWMKEKENQDTILLGTKYYAAPEQFGYGLSASTAKADIYAIGVLLNVMITGKVPQEERAQGDIWNIIERCISLNPDDRYSDNELIEALQKVAR